MCEDTFKMDILGLISYDDENVWEIHVVTSIYMKEKAGRFEFPK